MQYKQNYLGRQEKEKTQTCETYGIHVYVYYWDCHNLTPKKALMTIFLHKLIL